MTKNESIQYNALLKAIQKEIDPSNKVQLEIALKNLIEKITGRE